MVAWRGFGAVAGRAGEGERWRADPELPRGDRERAAVSKGAEAIVFIVLVALVLLVIGGAVVGTLSLLIGFVWALLAWLWVLTIAFLAFVVWLVKL